LAAQDIQDIQDIITNWTRKYPENPDFQPPTLRWIFNIPISGYCAKRALKVWELLRFGYNYYLGK
jgi:hypothetical protein